MFSCFCQKWLTFYDNKIYYIILFVYIIYPRVERSRIVMNWMRVEMFFVQILSINILLYILTLSCLTIHTHPQRKVSMWVIGTSQSPQTSEEKCTYSVPTNINLSYKYQIRCASPDLAALKLSSTLVVLVLQNTANKNIVSNI